jgi:hypothetical protein
VHRPQRLPPHAACPRYAGDLIISVVAMLAGDGCHNGGGCPGGVEGEVKREKDREQKAENSA